MIVKNLARFGNKKAFLDQLRKTTFDNEMKYHGCAQITVQTFLDVLGIDNVQLSMATSHLAGGIALSGNNCGALIGGVMVLGLAFGRDDVSKGMPSILQGIKPARRLLKYFQGKYGTINCRELTGTDLADPKLAQAYFESGGLEKCASMMSDTAAAVGEELYDAYVKIKTETEKYGR